MLKNYPPYKEVAFKTSRTLLFLRQLQVMNHQGSSNRAKKGNELTVRINLRQMII